LQQGLREDIQQLRTAGGNFKVARIGQDATNTLNQDIRVAETCFIDNSSASCPKQPNEARNVLYQVLNQVRCDLAQSSGVQLDAKLDELLYVYYPKGGFYRRHLDAVPGSASVLRSYSLLLYLNQDWTEQDGGQLRIHLYVVRRNNGCYTWIVNEMTE
jgi:Rps23 Pro-64 3,4-dihydroxylase Tpa1-like proline 4-hydroxylase